MNGDISAEERRLAALRAHAILDTKPEPAFDRIARLASDLLGEPIALLSLTDQDRQWFKASIGTDLTETPRERSFCHHAIRGREPLVVLDARKGKRFREAVLVKGPTAARFYAGVPIRDRDGMALGTLCVLSPKPKAEFSDRERDILVSLAGLASEALELRRDTVEVRLRSLDLDVLVRDMHTQLAKSLQLLAEVLDLQAGPVEDDRVKTPLSNASMRVKALAEVHRQLRRRHRSTMAELPSYMRVVARGAWAGTRALQAYPYVSFSLPETLDVPNDLAARMGLVAATLVVNATRAGADTLFVAIEEVDGALILVIRHEAMAGFQAGYDLDGRAGVRRMLEILAGRGAITVDPADPGKVSVRFQRR